MFCPGVAAGPGGTACGGAGRRRAGDVGRPGGGPGPGRGPGGGSAGGERPAARADTDRGKVAKSGGAEGGTAGREVLFVRSALYHILHTTPLGCHTIMSRDLFSFKKKEEEM